MKQLSRYILLSLLPTFFVLDLEAQTNKPTFTTDNGIGVIAPDSLFSLNFRFRTQLRGGYTSFSEDNFSAEEIEARVRRLRLRFEGFVLNPKINYYLQLSFSRGDMDWLASDNSKVNTSPNIIRDAVLTYKANEHLSLIFGQTKLPGNRQRVTSSGELQFPDRSIVNSEFNIDRDFGIQFDYKNNISNLHYVLKGAITSGEGRNSLSSDAGLAYTARAEILPFGKFTNKGDYFEGDLEREQSFKLSLGGGYHHNEGALRTGGTVGDDLYEERNISSAFTDISMKYKGFALNSEYIKRIANSPVTINDDNEESVIYAGEGLMAQLSYLFLNKVEVAGRYAITTPNDEIIDKVTRNEEMGIGLTKYLYKHRLKLQGQILHYKSTDLSINEKTGKWNAMFQIELGI